MPALNGWMLGRTRAVIDHVDDAFVVLLAARQRLVGLAGRMKRHAGAPLQDPAREHDVHRRASRVARHSGLAPDSAARLMDLLISEAHRHQCLSMPSFSTDESMTTPLPDAARTLVLRLLPPPARWRTALKVVPHVWQTRVLLRALSAAMASPEARRVMEPIAGRRLGILVEDLDLRWTLELHDGDVRLSAGEAEATVCGSATDLLLLAARQEDADTLFFQRRLKLTGDVELGLTLRNLLDRLPWESLPLASRLLLHRGSRLLRDARDQHRLRQERTA